MDYTKIRPLCRVIGDDTPCLPPRTTLPMGFARKSCRLEYGRVTKNKLSTLRPTSF